MAGRGRTSYQKRLKEQQRLERRQAKAARKQARHAAGDETPESPDVESGSETESESEPEAAAGNDQPSDDRNQD